MIGWLMAQSWFRSALAIGAAVLSGLLLFVRATRKAEQMGAIKEKLRSKDVADKAEAKMDAIPRPDKSDVVDKLRDGKF